MTVFDYSIFYKIYTVSSENPEMKNMIYHIEEMFLMTQNMLSQLNIFMNTYIEQFQDFEKYLYLRQLLLWLLR